MPTGTALWWTNVRRALRLTIIVTEPSGAICAAQRDGLELVVRAINRELDGCRGRRDDRRQKSNGSNGTNHDFIQRAGCASFNPLTPGADLRVVHAASESRLRP